MIKPSQPPWRGKIGTPFGGCATTFTQWEACHWIFGSLCSPASTLSPTHWILRSLPLPYESSSLVQLQFLCHPPLSSVGRQKESALMGRLGALLRSTCTSYAGCAQCPYGCSALCHMTLRESVERFYSPPPLNRGESGAAG